MIIRSGSLLHFSAALLLAAGVAACGAVKPYVAKEQKNWRDIAAPSASELMHSVYLIGDVGDPSTDGSQEPSLRLLEQQLRGKFYSEQDGGISQLPDSLKALLFLGDNIYLDGLSPLGDPEREEEEKILQEQMRIIRDWKGTPVFIPGNHDWNFSSEGGLAAVIRQGEYVREQLQNPRAFLPYNGCPGPVALPIGDKVVLILIDSEWWLTQHRRPQGPEGACYVESELDFIVQLDDMLNRYNDKHVVLALHHPLQSNGNHGGHYSLGDHIFPLRLKYPNLYIPLPLIGSIYPLVRMYGASRQDIANPKYQQLRNALASITSGRSNVVIAAGHDHNLQLQNINDVMHIISGAGCKETFAVGGRDALFVHKHEGFARLNYYKNGEVWAEFWVPEEEGASGRMTFRMPLYALKPMNNKEMQRAETVDYTDSTKVLAANPEYAQVGKLGRFLWGDHYRQEWTTPIQVPYLDMKTAKGGLTPVKKGGGKQTLSLRMINPDSLQYQLRSIDKMPAAVLPEGLRTTFAADVVQDQISSAHPYGFLTIPPMADAIGLLHTNPEVYYVPATPLLGQYISDFGGMLGMLEIRADEDLSAFKDFGYTEDAVSTRNVLGDLLDDNDDEVDSEAFAMARLFDMLIGDWDRHQDQWRWAEYEKEDKGKRYVPIPRDRDQVFVKFDGLLPWLASRKWGLRKFSHFDYEFDDVRGLNLNALSLDRRLLTGLSREQWVEQAQHIKTSLTDEIIEKAIRRLPPKIFEISGPEIIGKLKSRRDQLPAAAEEYYEALATYVDVYGSDKHELFLVERLANGNTRVQVYKMQKDGEVNQRIYDRTFLPSETREIRLWGFDGIDKFRISGRAESAIKLRVIGGEEDDEYRDESAVEGGNTIIYYDNAAEENKIESSNETNLHLSEKEYVNEWNQNEFFYPYLGPRVSLAYNPDDGLFVGGGVNLRTYGFRKSPAASDQTLLVNYAFATGAYNFRYKGAFYDLFGRFNDLLLNLDYQGPQYVMNYFGQGNETPYQYHIDYYRLRFNSFNAEALYNRRWGKHVRLGVGSRYRWLRLEENPNTVADSLFFRNSDLFDTEVQLLGGRAFLNVDAADNARIPTRGFRFFNSLDYTSSLQEDHVSLLRLQSDFSLYITPNARGLFKPTIALRFGGQRNWGDFLFFQSATIGNRTNLRGFRNNRFAGRSSLYQNTEIRVPISDIRSYALTGSWGLYGFIDHGRVWAEGEDSDKWHRGYGPGLFLNFYQFFVLSGNVAFSEEGPYYLLNAGFFF
ncbi:metallophosphoesterase [Cesiribacter sp. SM1]|uniref:BamA/TamA family outer membrane protein n=1 Tax=Cesiribacter sp. SM1 TaxID=2861196 RepID=UPI001CD3C317|nr:metallophosphoesterase [Cesiribacter sp. SM1]